MIKPTVGRVVHFWPIPKHEETDTPCAAIVAYVWHYRMVNLHVIDVNGKSYGVTSVPLRQPEDEKPSVGMYCEWMEYQKGQAAKYEALEAEKAAAK